MMRLQCNCSAYLPCMCSMQPLNPFLNKPSFSNDRKKVTWSQWVSKCSSWAMTGKQAPGLWSPHMELFHIHWNLIITLILGFLVKSIL